MKRNIGRYLILGHGKVPFYYRLRDRVITLLAWFLWGWLCWDVVHLVHLEFMHGLTDSPPREMIDWAGTVEGLRISFESSGLIIAVLFLFGIVNFSRIGNRTDLRRLCSEALTVDQQAPAYGCNGQDVIDWRKQRILSIEISDQGMIQTTGTN